MAITEDKVCIVNVLEFDELQDLKLNVCSCDCFSVGMWQPEGETFFSSKTGLCPEKTSFNTKALQFLDSVEDYDLLLTPEYSFPWHILDDIILKNYKTPKSGALWCFSMQGSSLSDFQERLQKYKKHMPKSLEPIFAEEKSFVDILCYVFQHNGKTYVLPQSKRKATAEEKQYLSTGKNVFAFIEKRIFLSYICADSNDTKEKNEIIESGETDCIIFHPQFNEKAFITNYKNMKIKALRNEKNLYLGLNWACGTKIKGDERNYGGYSCISRKSSREFNEFHNDIELKGKINSNHCKGLFFVQEESDYHFDNFLYTEDQIVKAEIDFNKKHIVSAESSILFDDGAYKKTSPCRIDIDDMIASTRQANVFRSRKCNCTSCDKIPDVVEYERFFSVCQAEIKKINPQQLIVDEHRAFKYDGQNMYRKAYRYKKDSKGCVHGRTALAGLHNCIYLRNFGRLYTDWEISMECIPQAFPSQEICNARFKPEIGTEELGIVCIIEHDKEEAIKRFELLQEMQKDKTNGKTILLYYKSGTDFKAYDEQQNVSDTHYPEFSYETKNYRKDRPEDNIRDYLKEKKNHGIY